MDIGKIPKPILVLGAFIIGIGLIVYGNRPHSLCDTQLDDFKELEMGTLFPMPVKNHGTAPPIYDRALNACREGQGSVGACLEYFKILSGVVKNLDPVGANCGEYLTEGGMIRKALLEGMKTLVLIAWGDELPDKDAKATGRLDPTEMALFCKLKTTWLKFNDLESYEAFKSSVIPVLPTKKFEMKDGQRVCTNCDSPPDLIQTMGGRNEVLKHTLFDLNCYPFQ